MHARRIQIIVVSASVAILLWISVTLSFDYTITVLAPLVIENIPENQSIAVPLPHAVQVRFRGNGWRGAALVFGNDAQCVIDIASLPNTRRKLGLNDIVDRMPGAPGLQPLDMRPESLLIDFDRKVARRVPVEFRGTLEFRSGYGQAGQISLSPESVTVIGAASVLQPLDTWPTGSVSFADIKSSIDAEIALGDSGAQYLSVVPRTVRMRVDVQQLAEKTIAGLPVLVRGVPSNREVILVPPRIDLVVRGGVDQLATLVNSEFVVSVEYDALLRDTTGFAEATVVPPEWIRVVSKKPDRMQFVLRKRL
jgi:hypothetical protein